MLDKIFCETLEETKQYRSNPAVTYYAPQPCTFTKTYEDGTKEVINGWVIYAREWGV